MDSTHTQSTLSPYTTTIALAGIAFLIIYSLMNKKPKYKGTLPPGPKPVPLFGNLLDVKKSDGRGPGIFDKWADEFGAIYSVRFGSYDGVILNTVDVIKEVFVKQGINSSGRATNVFFFGTVIGKAGKGIVFNEGQDWKYTRRTALHSMRDFGMGKKSLELRIQEEAAALVDVIDQYDEKPFDPRLALHNATSNVICSIVFGERYDYNDPDFNVLSDSLNILFTGGGFKNPELFIPCLTLLVPFTNRTFFKSFMSIRSLQRYIKEKIQEHRNKFDPDNIKSFIDVYLKADRDGDLDNKATEQNMLASIFDLFIAGSETSSTTLRWTLLYLMNHPAVQGKCQQEIAKEIGQVRPPTNSDRDHLPYIEATINEIQRLSNIAAYGVLHRTTADLEVAGFTIPRDYLIMSNLHHVHMDPEYWGDPKTFRPERWLGEDGKLIKHEAYMPFSIGPRECPGKSLATQELFILLVSLLQKFTFKAMDPDNPPKIGGIMGITHAPIAYDIIASKL